MRNSHLLAGILAPIVGLGGVFAAIAINRSWWRLTENAISDMGRVGLKYNWVMNASLVLAALLGIYYATWLIKRSRNALERAGIVIFAIGLAFLAAIGIFPEGTSPHHYVSWAFFLTASLGLLIAGAGMGIAGNREILYSTIAIFALAWILALWAMRTFKGVAIPEFIGVIGITAWHYLVMWRVAS
ncbi:DUF998 domain-containing protein [Thermococcus zilligii]|uniref:DUF998 domain-containing protein n=1 Tax=Thermococcus zilligii TaxID=54076 RepID=UPI00029A62B4|nr:DUF998 domain-containing protein [Thermococcus zilligii]